MDTNRENIGETGAAFRVVLEGLRAFAKAIPPVPLHSPLQWLYGQGGWLVSGRLASWPYWRCLVSADHMGNLCSWS